MKKILLSSAFVLIFIAYAIFSRTDDQAPAVVAPVIVSNTNSETPVTSTPTPTTTTTPVPTSPSTSSGSTTTKAKYKDGHYVGVSADAFYGNIQVAATVSGGKLTDVTFLQYPNDRETSIEINTQAMPFLKEEALAAQSANVDIISGATDSSGAFRVSLASALSQAKI